MARTPVLLLVVALLLAAPVPATLSHAGSEVDPKAAVQAAPLNPGPPQAVPARNLVQDLTDTPTPTSTPTCTSTPTSTPTPTATPPGDVTLTGLVYNASIGPKAGIPHAIVAVTVCFPRSFMATTGADGLYTLFLPASYLTGCYYVNLSARAPGYHLFEAMVSPTDLRQMPQQDIGLWRLPTWWLPVMLKTD